jgi:hypothetical protein
MKRLLSFLIISFALVPLPALADPVISGVSDMTVEATSASGAAVTFDATSSDATDGTDPVACSPASGSVFTLGTTTVSCTASDSLFATTTLTFDVGVVDRTPPAITAPAPQSFATTTFPASPALTLATATDLVTPSPEITVSPATFGAGTTTVIWSATDEAGNVATTSSEVGVFLNADVHVDVPDTCEATDTDSVVHSYAASSSANYLGICALQAAIASSSLASVELSNQYPTLGLFLAGVDGVSADPSSEYWALYQNGAFASAGLTTLPVAAGDTIQFQLHDFSDNDLGSRVTLHIDTLIATSSPTSSPDSSGSGGGGGGGGSTHGQFNLGAALAFLASKQNADGSFGTPANPTLTDWAALALASAGSGSSSYAKLKAYEQAATPSLSSATDYERHAMALEALGINPYSGSPADSVSPIVAKFDGTQIGVASEDNDDIFALFALAEAGYGPNDPLIQKEVAFILSQQKADGSWDESPDLTAAAVDALGPFLTTPQSAAALQQGLGYLFSLQQTSGGWSSIDTTSWAQTAINGILNARTPGFSSESSFAAPSGFYPTDALSSAQQGDGGVASAGDRTWSTSYAAVAASGKDWWAILQPFAKPQPQSYGGGGGLIDDTSASSTATTTIDIATSTLSVATSTPLSASSTSLMATSTLALSTAASSSSPKPIIKPHTVRAAPKPATAPKAPPAQAASEQTAAAADAHPATPGFLGSVWHAIVGFFSGLF